MTGAYAFPTGGSSHFPRLPSFTTAFASRAAKSGSSSGGTRFAANGGGGAARSTGEKTSSCCEQREFHMHRICRVVALTTSVIHGVVSEIDAQRKPGKYSRFSSSESPPRRDSNSSSSSSSDAVRAAAAQAIAHNLRSVSERVKNGRRARNAGRASTAVQIATLDESGLVLVWTLVRDEATEATRAGDNVYYAGSSTEPTYEKNPSRLRRG